MKTFFPLLLLALLPLLGSAQYFVVKTVGKVYADGVLLVPRSEIEPEAELRFSSQEAYAHVLSTTKGHFILTGRKGRKNAKGEFFSALKDALIPPDEFLAAATRGISEDAAVYAFEDQYDLKAFFRDRVVLLDSFGFRLTSELYPVDEQRFFLLRSQPKRKLVERRLPQLGDTVLIPPQRIRSRRRPTEAVATELVYRDATTDTEEVISRFSLRTLSAAEIERLRAEVLLIYERVDPPSQRAFERQHLLPYLRMNYGTIPFGDRRSLLPAE